MNKIKYIFYLLLSLSAVLSKGQNFNLDSFRLAQTNKNIVDVAQSYKGAINDREDSVCIILSKEILKKIDNTLPTLKNKTQLLRIKAEILDLYAISFKINGDIANSISTDSLALKIYVQLNDKEGIAEMNNNIGSSYYDLGQLNIAIKHFFSALKISEKSKSFTLISLCYGNLGSAYKGMEDFEKANLYYNKALEFAIKGGDKRHISGAYNLLSGMAMKQKKVKEAIELAKKALEIRRGLDSKRDIAQSYNNLGAYYNLINETQIAMAYFDSCQKISIELNIIQGIIETSNNLSRLYLKVKNYMKAILETALG